MSDDPPTEELRKAHFQREEDERERARSASDEQETAQHERRADKADYLRRKLDRVTDILWAGGVTNPVTYIEQISYLIYLKLLDDGWYGAKKYE